MKKISIAITTIYTILYMVFPLNANATGTSLIGDFCTSDSECVSGDCEGNEFGLGDGICDCHTDASCQVGLGPNAGPGWKCINKKQDPLKRGLDFCVKTESPSYPPNNTDTVKYPVDHKLAIGEKCAFDAQCITDDCEDSSVEERFNNYCVCKTARHCFEQYGLDEKDWACSDDDADTTHKVYYCKQLSTNRMIDPTGRKSDAGLLEVLGNPEAYVQMFTQELDDMLRKPSPKISIPGLTFSEIDIANMTTVEGEKTYLNIPFIGEYMTSVYKYGMVLAGIIAVCFILYGGILMMMSGGTSEGKQAAQKRITQAVVGLIIALLSYIILYTINPNLVQFKNLKILYLEKIELEEAIEDSEEHMDIPGQTIFNGNFPTINDPGSHAKVPGPDRKISDLEIKTLAQASNIDPCLLWAGIRKESSSVQQVGSDENSANTKASYVGRRLFLQSGKKYSGKTFDPANLWRPNTPAKDEKGPGFSSEKCFDSSKLIKLPDPRNGGYTPLHNDARTPDGCKIFNDAPGTTNFNYEKQRNLPDYGYDWRFPKGIGLRQITINPNAAPLKINGPNGPEFAIKINDHYYTVTDLLNPEMSMKAVVDWHLAKLKRASCQTAHSTKNLHNMWTCMGVGEKSIPRAIQKYKECPASVGPQTYR